MTAERLFFHGLNAISNFSCYCFGNTWSECKTNQRATLAYMDIGAFPHRIETPDDYSILVLINENDLRIINFVCIDEHADYNPQSLFVWFGISGNPIAKQIIQRYSISAHLVYTVNTDVFKDMKVYLNAAGCDAILKMYRAPTIPLWCTPERKLDVKTIYEELGDTEKMMKEILGLSKQVTLEEKMKGLTIAHPPPQ